jgi:hypothetical protein
MGLKLLSKTQKEITLAFVIALLTWSAVMALLVAAGICPWTAHDISLLVMFTVFALLAYRPLKQAGVFKKIGEMIED